MKAESRRAVEPPEESSPPNRTAADRAPNAGPVDLLVPLLLIPSR